MDPTTRTQPSITNWPGPCGGHCAKSGGKISQKPFLLRLLAVFSLGYLHCHPGGPGLFWNS